MQLNQLFNFSEKKELTTGWSRSIGKVMAVGLAEDGADIVEVFSTLNCEAMLKKM